MYVYVDVWGGGGAAHPDEVIRLIRGVARAVQKPRPKACALGQLPGASGISTGTSALLETHKSPSPAQNPPTPQQVALMVPVPR